MHCAEFVSGTLQEGISIRRFAKNRKSGYLGLGSEKRPHGGDITDFVRVILSRENPPHISEGRVHYAKPHVFKAESGVTVYMLEEDVQYKNLALIRINTRDSGYRGAGIIHPTVNAEVFASARCIQTRTSESSGSILRIDWTDSLVVLRTGSKVDIKTTSRAANYTIELDEDGIPILTESVDYVEEIPSTDEDIITNIKLVGPTGDQVEIFNI